MMWNSNNKQETGISLLEILISILFFSLIALSLAHTLTGSLYVTARDNDIVKATNLAQQYFGEVEHQWQAQIDFDSPLLPYLGNYQNNGTYNLENSYYTQDGKYTVTVTTKNVAQDHFGNVNLRRVSISYNDFDDNHLIDLYMDFSRPGSYVIQG